MKVKNEKNIKENLEQTITKRLNDYKLAIKYFEENDLKIKIEDAIMNKDILEDYLQKIKSGKSSQIKEKDIPKEIDPEFIYGYKTDERIRKFLEIFSKIFDEKQKLKDEVKSMTSVLLQLTSEQLNNQKSDIEKSFAELKEKKLKYDSIINILKEDFLDEWIPAPLLSETKETKEVEIINEDMEPNTIIIEFGKTNYIKESDKIKIEITCTLGETGKTEKWYQQKPGEWNHIITWDLSEKEYSDISKENLKFEVFELINKNKKKYKAKGLIPLNFLEDNISYESEFKFELETKRMIPSVNIKFKIRNCSKKKYKPIQIRKLCFTKFYPSFKKK